MQVSTTGSKYETLYWSSQLVAGADSEVITFSSKTCRDKNIDVSNFPTLP